MQKIDPASLVAMDRFAATTPLRVEVAYAHSDNLLFGERIYRPEARLWLHKTLADVVIRAAAECAQRHDLRYILYDGLRTVDAQEAMLQTRKVQDNPHWLEEPRLLSPPGTGGHPRGMAIDIGLETMDGQLIDMGTPFDFLAADSSPEKNPAHREYKNLTPDINARREILTGTMLAAAKALNTSLVPLPQEWWDFRLPSDFFNGYAPLSEADLPADMKLMG